jgi:hypothetical protein
MAMGVQSVGSYAGNYYGGAAPAQPAANPPNPYYQQDAYQAASNPYGQPQPQDVAGSFHLGAVAAGALAGLMTVVRIARAPGPWALVGAVAIGGIVGDWLYNKVMGRS